MLTLSVLAGMILKGCELTCVLTLSVLAGMILKAVR